METYAIVLVLTSLISGLISILNIVFPFKAIGFANRGRAAHLLALSFLLFVTGAITAGISASDNPQGNLWVWVLSFVAAYGLFRFVRSGRKKDGNESVRGSNSNGVQVAPILPALRRTPLDGLVGRARVRHVGSSSVSVIVNLAQMLAVLVVLVQYAAH